MTEHTQSSPQSDANLYRWSELQDLRRIDHAIQEALANTKPPSIAHWATRIYAQARSHAKETRGTHTGRLVLGRAFCEGFAAGGDTPVARIIGAQRDHLLAFIAGAAYRGYVDDVPQHGDRTARHELHDTVRQWDARLGEIKASRINRLIESVNQ